MEEDEILALYRWAPGRCFRHPACGETETALVKTIHPQSTSPPAEVRACRDCVLALEGDRREAAVRARVRYEPGRVGESIP